MNSLNYLSRHLDGLASSRTPPNTPTTEFTAHPPLQPSPSADDSSTAHRAAEHATWSLRSLVAPPPPPRRSLSSPARTPTLRRRPSFRTAIRAKSQSTNQSVLRRLFFVRILELVWHALCTAAASLRVDDLWHERRLNPRGFRPRRGSAVVGQEEPSVEGREGMDLPAQRVGAEQALSHTDSVVKSPVSFHTPSSAVNPLSVVRVSTDPPAPSATLSVRPSLAYIQPQFFAALMPTPPPSRTPTPTYSPSAGLPIAPRKTPFHLPKTLVLDLDETLIHSTSRPLPAAGIRGLFGSRRAASHTVEVVLGGRSTLYHVYKRPFVDYFLRKVRVANLGHSRLHGRALTIVELA